LELGSHGSSSALGRMAGMKPVQFSLSSLFWMVILAASVVAIVLGAPVVGIPLGCVAAFVLADRYRKRIESDPAYIPPTEEEIEAKHKAQDKGWLTCLVIAVVVGIALTIAFFYALGRAFGPPR
jgi:hypothetical protein